MSVAFFVAIWFHILVCYGRCPSAGSTMLLLATPVALSVAIQWL